MKKFLADKSLECIVNDWCLTYIQALELIGVPVPSSARERNMLNVFARLPVAQPLRSTVMIVDISQAIDRCYPKTDGTVPTACINAKLWSIRAGRTLDVIEVAKLMGHELDKVDLKGITESQMRRMLGNSMHVATAGFALIGLLAAVGSSDTAA